MNVKKILCLAVIMSAAVNASAMELHKGKVISDKVWSPDGSKATLVYSKHARTRYFDDGKLSAFTNVYLKDSGGVANVPVTIENHHALNLYNFGDEKSQYYIHKWICVDTSVKQAHCVIQDLLVELEPQGSLYDETSPGLTLTFDSAGRYPVRASTGVSKDRWGGKYESFSHAEGTLTIA
jgi:hypothetical protein